MRFPVTEWDFPWSMRKLNQICPKSNSAANRRSDGQESQDMMMSLEQKGGPECQRTQSQH